MVIYFRSTWTNEIGQNGILTVGADVLGGPLEVKFKKFPKDFFDLVIIDECHRGVHAAHYCERVTADDGTVGVKEFRNNENVVPTVLTTSQKLSTGVDACNVRSIVLLKQVKRMVEFKQIIGRGTRLCDGKPYFTIYDFTDATSKFQDPDWDGPVVCPKCHQNPCVCGDGKVKGEGEERKPHPPCPTCGCWPCICERPSKKPVDVTLSNGRVIAAYWQDKIFFDNEMLTAADFLRDFAFEVLPLTSGIGVRSCALIEQFALSHNLRVGDAIIAATAIENDVMLCTTNVKRYRQIPMLSLFPLKVS